DQGERQDTDIVETNGKKEISINKPAVFDGDRTKSKSFLQDCYLYININNNIYNTDKKKIAFILLFCMEGGAKLWKEQQKPNKRVEDIINKFKLLVGLANLGTETESDHAHLIGLFQKCITPQLTDRILPSKDDPRLSLEKNQKNTGERHNRTTSQGTTGTMTQTGWITSQINQERRLIQVQTTRTPIQEMPTERTNKPELDPRTTKQEMDPKGVTYSHQKLKQGQKGQTRRPHGQNGI
ncbi:hypothetical protein CVT25_002598, partial [Psilocybe cyanescens]